MSPVNSAPRAQQRFILVLFGHSSCATKSKQVLDGPSTAQLYMASWFANSNGHSHELTPEKQNKEVSAVSAKEAMCLMLVVFHRIAKPDLRNPVPLIDLQG
jgi:hypothetical protein